MNKNLRRFVSKVQVLTNGCWYWLGRKNRIRFNRAFFDVGGRRRIAARWLWEEVFGPLEPGECVLHTCDNPACVNPWHLFSGTQIDNIRDRDAKGRNRLSATHCVNGHEFSPENTYSFGPEKRWRGCRICRRAFTLKHRLNQKAEAHT